VAGAAVAGASAGVSVGWMTTVGSLAPNEHPTATAPSAPALADNKKSRRLIRFFMVSIVFPPSDLTQLLNVAYRFAKSMASLTNLSRIQSPPFPLFL
jgi:hypothetical protein